MDKEFVTYEQALALEDLGFNEKCLAYFDYYGKIVELCLKDSDWDGCGQDAPLKQHVLRWFREKYNADFYISRSLPNVINKDIYFIVLNDLWAPNDSYKNYEDAESRLIDNLIELAKQQDNEKQ
jgi:hypothetical protein